MIAIKTFSPITLSILVLLAVAAPSCLAAENSANYQQPAPQYSKLPPLQLSGSTLTQKEYLQAAIWLAQQNTNRLPGFSGQAAAQANTSAKESGAPSDLDITKLDAKTFWPSVGVLVAAIFTLLGTMYTNLVTLKKTRIELDHQESASARAQCKDYCIEYIEKIDITNLQKGNYDQLRIRYLATAIVVFAPDEYSKYPLRLMSFINSNKILIGSPKRFQNDPQKMAQYNAVLEQYKSMFAFIVLHTKEMICGSSLKKHLKSVRKQLAGQGFDKFLE